MKRFSFSWFLALFSVISLCAQSSKDMTMLSNWRPDEVVRFNDIWGYTDCAGNEYAIIGSYEHVHFVNITDPQNPVEITRFAGGESTIWRDMKTYRDRAYAVSDATNEGLMIFDMSQLPQGVEKTYQSNGDFGKAHNIFIDNGRLYVCGADTRSNGLIVYDIATNPDQPILLSSLDLDGGYVHDLYVRNDTAYCSHGYNGFFVWDYQNTESPALIASIETGAYNHSSWVNDEVTYAFYAEEVPQQRPMGVIDLTNMDNNALEISSLFQVSLLDTASRKNTPHNPYLRGDYAVISYYEDGVQIVDLNDPLQPTLVAYYDTYENSEYSGYNGCWGVYPFFESGNIIASDISNGLFVLSADEIEWKPMTYPATPSEDARITSQTQGVCEGEMTTVFIDHEAADAWVWTDDEDPQTGVDSIEIEGNSTVYAVAFNGHCMGDTQAVFFEEIETEVPVLTYNYLTRTLTVSGGQSFQWYRDSMLLPGENGMSITVTDDGEYYVVVTDESGCETSSSLMSILVNTRQPTLDMQPFLVVPNPAYDFISLQMPNAQNRSVSYSIYNLLGERVLSGVYAGTIDIRNLPSGWYALRASVYSISFLKQ